MVSYLITNIKYITRVCAHKIGPTNWVSAWANQVFLGLTIPVGEGPPQRKAKKSPQNFTHSMKYVLRARVQNIGPKTRVSARAYQVFLGLTIPVGLGGQIPEWRERAGGRRGGGGGVVEVAAEVVGGLGAWGLVAD